MRIGMPSGERQFIMASIMASTGGVKRFETAEGSTYWARTREEVSELKKLSGNLRAAAKGDGLALMATLEAAGAPLNVPKARLEPLQRLALSLGAPHAPPHAVVPSQIPARFSCDPREIFAKLGEILGAAPVAESLDVGELLNPASGPSAAAVTPSLPAAKDSAVVASSAAKASESSAVQPVALGAAAPAASLEKAPPSPVLEARAAIDALRLPGDDAKAIHGYLNEALATDRIITLCSAFWAMAPVLVRGGQTLQHNSACVDVIRKIVTAVQIFGRVPDPHRRAVCAEMTKLMDEVRSNLSDEASGLIGLSGLIPR